jgi:hypothetical protein
MNGMFSRFVSAICNIVGIAASFMYAQTAKKEESL